MTTLADGDEQCPACKTKKSASPNLRFKINTKCYHRICESCIDRTYASGGQNQCPYPGCKNSFWKQNWRTQTFEDLKVEKEINIRRDIYNTLRRDEDEFVDKRAYDDFLELREMFVMNLLLNTDAQSTRQRLNEYREANGLTRDKTKTLAASGKPKLSRKVDADYPDRSGLIEGLKRIIPEEVLPPYDPLEGLPVIPDYYSINEDMDTGYEQYKKDAALEVEGYDFRDALEESLTRAFAGLGVFVQAEKTGNVDGSNVKAAAVTSDEVF